MTQETNNLAADLWALADLLRGDFRQSQYGRVILPFALLRRLECVLESSKSAVLAEAAKVEKMAIAEEAKEKLLLRATGGLSFFNTSPMDLSTLRVLKKPSSALTKRSRTWKKPRKRCTSRPTICAWPTTRPTT
jgi:type I restriction-modification system DNA methylase subunit